MEALQNPAYDGVYNGTAPNPVRMSELCSSLGEHGWVASQYMHFPEQVFDMTASTVAQHQAPCACPNCAPAWVNLREWHYSGTLLAALITGRACSGGHATWWLPPLRYRRCCFIFESCLRLLVSEWAVGGVCWGALLVPDFALQALHGQTLQTAPAICILLQGACLGGPPGCRCRTLRCRRCWARARASCLTAKGCCQRERRYTMRLLRSMLFQNQFADANLQTLGEGARVVLDGQMVLPARAQMTISRSSIT